ncbi:MAG: excinuclease ABC subunit A [Bacteroidia bacterium]|jgi:excinuclease ABC subunit A|tara:strand:- start:438 stop:3224 length:2787 start_codon:yes stop_codon:yes gene_type:complete
MTKQKYIDIQNAHLHNLKNVDVKIPRNQLTVVTGLSGSGKSSLVFNTLYAEGQRRYVESLSSYARQFLGRLEKPMVDNIRGLTPCIAIEQKVNTRNPRSTVATSTELYDYLKLLWARVGKTMSPISGKEVKKHSTSDVINYVLELNVGTPVYICYRPIEVQTNEYLETAMQKGYSRIWTNGEVLKVEEAIGNKKIKDYYILVDRLKATSADDAYKSRLSDSIETAFWEGEGQCTIITDTEQKTFNNKFELDGMTFEEPSVNLLSFNNPYGACSECEGFGSIIGIDPELVIPNRSLSVYENAIACWKGETLSQWRDDFIASSAKTNFPIHRAVSELTEKELDLLWQGNEQVSGLNNFFKYLQSNSYKIQYRVMLSKYRGKTTCPSCLGTRIRKDGSYVKITNLGANPKFIKDKKLSSLSDMLLLNIEQASEFFNSLKLENQDAEIAKPILMEVNNRLDYLMRVGLSYLGLNRLSNSLSGGESQRINLATSLGSSLVGSSYILDEPSIGLHSKDTERLISVLQNLKEKGNTVVVVEHDEDMMRTADFVIDMGPEAGHLGGEVVFAGHYSELKGKDTLTAKYLDNVERIEIPKTRRKWNNRVSLLGASQHNLKGIDVDIPLNTLTVVTGVSGSGKTSLVKGILYPAVLRETQQYSTQRIGEVREIKGDFSSFSAVELVDQNPIGKSSRSNPVTYVKAYDAIRELFSTMPIAKQRGFKTKHFSFNVDGGRCDNCQGEGEEVVEMQFMADLHLTCEECNGKKFKEEVLEVEFKQKSIYDVLNLTVEEAVDFFRGQKTIVNKLLPLQEVGLGYVKLGQSSNSLSGGEAQRIKLATFLGKSQNKDKVLFIFDEPTTGLHFHDIKKLLKSFNALVDKGHSVVVIEHNLDVVKCADWVIDLGPEGGDKGGELMFAGIPEDLAKSKKSVTGQFLKEKM